VAVSNFGPEFDAAMKAMREADPRPAQMRTWYCPECTAKLGKHTIQVDKGRPGCSTCPHYEERVGVAW
jgi:uncharacterized protein YlaI